MRFPAIPANWEQVGAAAIGGTRTAHVRVWSGPNPDQPDYVFDPATGTETRNRGAVVHDGMARIQQHPTPTEETAGGQQVTTHRYLVAVPRDWDRITLRCWVEVLDATDGQLVGEFRWLQVVDLMHGSLRFERDLICTINLQ